MTTNSEDLCLLYSYLIKYTGYLIKIFLINPGMCAFQIRSLCHSNFCIFYKPKILLILLKKRIDCKYSIDKVVMYKKRRKKANLIK